MKFQKGHTPWNKGKKGLQKAWNKGIPNPKIKERNLKNNPSKSEEARKKISEANSGEKSGRWKGGCRKYFRDKIYRRRIEEVIGRKLKSYEIIHHIDGNYKNNELNNLVIVTRSQHAKIHWAQNDIRR